MSPTPHTGPFNLEQTGIDVQLVPTLTSPYALGLWLAEQPARTQALMLAGWLQGLEEPQATAMLRMVNVGRELRELAAPLTGACAALEHLLGTTRGYPTGITIPSSAAVTIPSSAARDAAAGSGIEHEAEGDA